MRNLKKILALVLALIMSLSLMATAGATDFTDDADITADFSESVDVLAGLKVFGGYGDNSFQPQGEITRAEVAAIIYRIVTGQVGEDQTYKIYADYNTFDDVKAEDWFAGYVNFCANAEYVKGVGYAANGKAKFDPQGKVTGYQALAMILRAVGYDKNGEFTGASWQVQTAATAQQLHITDKISSGTLGGAATRETVAEILCKAIQVPTVKYTPAFGYRDYETDPNVKNVNLAKSVFNMERLEGIVMANEYADLEDTDTLAANKTRLQVGDKAYTMNVTTDLTDIGESRYVYVRPTANKDYDLVVSEMYDTGNNVTYDNVDKALSDPADKVSDLLNGLKEDKDVTEYYLNFDPYSEWSSEIRIGYFITEDEIAVLDKTDSNGKAQTNSNTGARWKYLDGKSAAVKIDHTKPENAHYGADGWLYWIKPDTAFDVYDREIITSIFQNADLRPTSTENTDNGVIVRGEVYVGTQAMVDVSDTKSLKQFKEEWIDENATAKTYSSALNGSWLKVIDNDNNGVVDYVLLTECSLEQIVDSTTAKDESVTYYYGTKLTASPTYLKADSMEIDGDVKIEVGKVIVAATIDGKVYAREAEHETATINSISYANHTATNTDGETYYQSRIQNNTDMDEEILNMNEKTEYTVYKDFFGYVRAYTGPGNAYGLLTEVYPTYSYNSQLVQNRILTAELTRAEDNGATKEYQVLNSWNSNTGWNPFYNEATIGWDSVRVVNNDRLHHDNYLQRAIAELDMKDTVNKVTEFKDNAHTAIELGYEFDYTENKTIKTTTSDKSTHTWTNVAKYSLSDEGANLYTASEYMYNKAGEQLYYADLTDDKVTNYTRETRSAIKTATGWTDAQFDSKINDEIFYVYAEDYVQLAIGDIGSNKARWTIDENYYNSKNEVLSNTFINATVDTDFYVVSRSDRSDVGGYVRYYKGYNKLPAYTMDNNDIHAIYAVAKNTTADNATKDYWVADVIVIELGQIKDAYTSVSFAFFNDSKTTNAVRFLKTLNNRATGIEEDLIPEGYTWNGRWDDQDFYGLTGETTDADGIKHAYIQRLGDKLDIGGGKYDYSYNRNSVYAGYVNRMNELKTYVNVDKNNDGNPDVDVIFTGVPIYTVGETSVTRTFWSDRVNGNDPTGHNIIWVGSESSPSFILDLGKVGDVSGSVWDKTPGWLKAMDTETSIFGRIMYDQGVSDTVAVEGLDVTFYNQTKNEKNVPYSAVKDLAEDKWTIVLETKAGKTMEKVSVTKTANGETKTIDVPASAYSANKRTVTIKIEKPELNAVTYNVTVIGRTGGNLTDEVITLKQGAAFSSTELKGVKNDVMTDGYLNKKDALDLLAYMESFEYPEGATTTWEFTRTGTTDVIKVVRDADGKYSESENTLKGLYLYGISKIKATVVNDTKTQVYYDYTNAPESTVTLTDVTVTYKNAEDATVSVSNGNKVKVGTKLTITISGDKDIKVNGKTIESTFDGTDTTATYTVETEENISITAAAKNAAPETPTMELAGVDAIANLKVKVNNVDANTGDGTVDVKDGKVELLLSGKAGKYLAYVYNTADVGGGSPDWTDAVKAGKATTYPTDKPAEIVGADGKATISVNYSGAGYTIEIVEIKNDEVEVSFVVTDHTDVPLSVAKNNEAAESIRQNYSKTVSGLDTLTIEVPGYTISDVSTSGTDADAVLTDGVVTYYNFNETTATVTVTLIAEAETELEQNKTDAENEVNDVTTAVGGKETITDPALKTQYETAMTELQNATSTVAAKKAQAKALAALMGKTYTEPANEEDPEPWVVAEPWPANQLEGLKNAYANSNGKWNGKVLDLTSNDFVSILQTPDVRVGQAITANSKLVFAPSEDMIVIDLTSEDAFKAQVEANDALWLGLLDYSYGLGATTPITLGHGCTYTIKADSTECDAGDLYARLINTDGDTPNLSNSATPHYAVFMRTTQGKVFPITDVAALELTPAGYEFTKVTEYLANKWTHHPDYVAPVVPTPGA